MNNCKICSNAVAARDRLSCSSCREQYHYACASILKMNYQKMKDQQLAQWLCTSCKASDPRHVRPTSVNNLTTTPNSRSSSPTSPSKCVLPADLPPKGSAKNLVPANLSGEKPDTPSLSTLLEHITAIREDLKGLNIIRKEIRDIKGEFLELKASIEFNDKRIDNLEEKVTTFDEKLSKASAMEELVSSLQLSVKTLQHQHDLREQKCREENIEITGIHQRQGEDLFEVLMNIAKAAGQQVRREDIEFATRVAPRAVVPNRPKTIIAKFHHRQFKDAIISGIRTRKGLTTKDIGLPGPSSNVYAKDHLTIKNKELYKQTRELAKTMGFHYTWTRNCRIFVRRNDTSPALSICTTEDLKKITS